MIWPFASSLPVSDFRTYTQLHELPDRSSDPMAPAPSAMTLRIILQMFVHICTIRSGSRHICALVICTSCLATDSWSAMVICCINARHNLPVCMPRGRRQSGRNCSCLETGKPREMHLLYLLTYVCPSWLHRLAVYRSSCTFRILNSFHVHSLKNFACRQLSSHFNCHSSGNQLLRLPDHLPNPCTYALLGPYPCAGNLPAMHMQL